MKCILPTKWVGCIVGRMHPSLVKRGGKSMAANVQTSNLNMAPQNLGIYVFTRDLHSFLRFIQCRASSNVVKRRFYPRLPLNYPFKQISVYLALAFIILQPSISFFPSAADSSLSMYPSHRNTLGSILLTNSLPL